MRGFEKTNSPNRRIPTWLSSLSTSSLASVDCSTESPLISTSRAPKSKPRATPAVTARARKKEDWFRFLDWQRDGEAFQAASPLLLLLPPSCDETLSDERVRGRSSSSGRIFKNGGVKKKKKRRKNEIVFSFFSSSTMFFRPSLLLLPRQRTPFLFFILPPHFSVRATRCCRF